MGLAEEGTAADGGESGCAGVGGVEKGGAIGSPKARGRGGVCG
jgi:hypothetical protein